MAKINVSINPLYINLLVVYWMWRLKQHDYSSLSQKVISKSMHPQYRSLKTHQDTIIEYLLLLQFPLYLQGLLLMSIYASLSKYLA